MIMLPRLHKPGLFVTATDTGVGKTVVSCAIAQALRQQLPTEQHPHVHIGVCKPMATGCRRDREGLVNEDAEALAHFADCRLSLEVINPLRFRPPVAPAVAAEHEHLVMDFDLLGRSLRVLDESCDALLIEGVGGVMVPINPHDPHQTVLDLMQAIGYPVLVVCRAMLGTLNHTLLTVSQLRHAGLTIAGLVVNGFDADSARRGRDEDLAMTTNRTWLMKMTGLPILATVPAVELDQIDAGKGRIPPAILEAVALTYWPDVLKPATVR